MAGAPFAYAFDEAVAIDDGVDGAFGGTGARRPEEELPDLAGTPVRLAALGFDDGCLVGQLIGMAHGPVPGGQRSSQQRDHDDRFIRLA